MSTLNSKLRDWLKWATNGAPNTEPFERRYGICSGLDAYGELGDIFEAQGLDRAYPFGLDNYVTHRSAGTQHEDPIRLMWVRMMVNPLRLTPELHTALQDWLDWATNGTPEHAEFTLYTGLCHPLLIAPNGTRCELKTIFTALNLDNAYPFGVENYHERARAKTQHEDPHRLVFVRTILSQQ